MSWSWRANVAVRTMVARGTACLDPGTNVPDRDVPSLLEFDYSTARARARGEAGVETSAGPGHAT